MRLLFQVCDRCSLVFSSPHLKAECGVCVKARDAVDDAGRWARPMTTAEVREAAVWAASRGWFL